MASNPHPPQSSPQQQPPLLLSQPPTFSTLKRSRSHSSLPQSKKFSDALSARLGLSRLNGLARSSDLLHFNHSPNHSIANHLSPPILSLSSHDSLNADHDDDHDHLPTNDDDAHSVSASHSSASTAGSSSPPTPLSSPLSSSPEIPLMLCKPIGRFRIADEQHSLPLRSLSPANPSRQLRTHLLPLPVSAHPRSTHSVLLVPLALLGLLLVASLAVIAIALRTLPALRLPTSLEAVRLQIVGLEAYANDSYLQAAHTAGVLALVFVFKQAFSVPGTVLLNVLIGAIYGTWLATVLTCFLTAIGSSCAYAIAMLARPLVARLMPTPLRATERAVARFRLPGAPARFDGPELASYLLIARLLPVVPYAGLNLASGVLGLPLGPFFWTLVVGSLPYNFVTTQLGEILSVASHTIADSKPGTSSLDPSINGGGLAQIWTPNLLAKLLVVSLIGAVPVLFKSRLIKLVSRIQLLRGTSSSSLRRTRIRRRAQDLVGKRLVSDGRTKRYQFERDVGAGVGLGVGIGITRVRDESNESLIQLDYDYDHDYDCVYEGLDGDDCDEGIQQAQE